MGHSPRVHFLILSNCICQTMISLVSDLPSTLDQTLHLGAYTCQVYQNCEFLIIQTDLANFEKCHARVLLSSFFNICPQPTRWCALKNSNAWYGKLHCTVHTACPPCMRYSNVVFKTATILLSQIIMSMQLPCSTM